MERGSANLALHIRERLPAKNLPNPEEINQFLAETQQRFSSFNQTLTNNRSEVVEVLSAIKSALQDEGQTFSRPSICAEFINLSTTEHIYEEALQHLRLGNEKQFVLTYDLAEGLSSPMTALISAENYIKGEPGGKGVEDLDFCLGMKADEQVEAFLFYNESRKKAANALIKDPSGFTLLDERKKIISLAKTEGVLQPVEELGINQSITIYKKLYPLTENLC